MPQENIPADAELDALVERVRQQYDMATAEEALEFLLRRRLRKGSRRITGRGRALHEVGASRHE